MEKEVTEKKLKTGESFVVVLQSRGGLGLQMMYKTEPEGIASVMQAENNIGTNPQPGDSIEAQYKIEALKVGKCHVTFYETQPWNKSFEPIVQKEIVLEVVN